MVDRIYSYNPRSKGAAALARALGVKRIKHQRSRFRGSPRLSIINWGAATLPASVLRCRVINRPEAVAVASDKLRFFRAMEGADLTPPFCTTLAEASEAMSRKEDRWATTVCRTILTGHSGAGIVLADSPAELVEAPLYVRYIKKSQEFRAHVIRGTVVDVTRKGRDRSLPDDAINWRIRNHSNGFIYAREGVERWIVSGELERAAQRTVEICALDFGAVDLIWNEHSARFYVLEVNTAPGLEGSTLSSYVRGLEGV